jgi:hypothetical protein
MEEPLELECRRVVGRAEEADRAAAEHERGRDQPGRVEVVAGAVAEGDDDGGDEKERGGDATEPGAALARGVEPGLPEDEQRDRDQERQPLVHLRLPEQAPEDGVAVEDAAEDEREVDPEREADRVEHRKRDDGERAAHERA